MTIAANISGDRIFPCFSNQRVTGNSFSWLTKKGYACGHRPIYDRAPEHMKHLSHNANANADNHHHDAVTKFRLPQQLLCKAQEAARQRQESLSAILRRYLEAYASEQPLKQAE